MSDKLLKKIQSMPKYKALNIPTETIESIIKICTPISKNAADLEKRVREKIHNITALYLGDIDYAKATAQLNEIKHDQSAVREFALQSLTFHASTKERGQDLEPLYAKLFAKIGHCNTIADLACGLHPLGIPFMNLPQTTAYYAYDLHKTRADFLHTYITSLGYSGGCFHQDILTTPPQIHFCAAFFFKEAHRFEKRQPGSTCQLLDGISATKKVVSLPIQSIGTASELSPIYEQILRNYSAERNCGFDHFTHGNEIFYIIAEK